HLKGLGGRHVHIGNPALAQIRESGIPKASVFETGTNQWRSFPAWPPVDAKPMSLHLWNGGSLSPIPDLSRDAVDSIQPPPNFDEFVSDPAKPVPFMNKTVQNMAREYMTGDQRFASRRTDVLVYQSSILDKDTT